MSQSFWKVIAKTAFAACKNSVYTLQTLSLQRAKRRFCHYVPTFFSLRGNIFFSSEEKVFLRTVEIVASQC